MTNFRPIFENDWCGIETFLKDVLSPVFGDYEQGYDVLTNEPEVREKAKNANITEIRHAATFDANLKFLILPWEIIKNLKITR